MLSHVVLMKSGNPLRYARANISDSDLLYYESRNRWRIAGCLVCEERPANISVSALLSKGRIRSVSKTDALIPICDHSLSTFNSRDDLKTCVEFILANGMVSPTFLQVQYNDG